MQAEINFEERIIFLAKDLDSLENLLFLIFGVCIVSALNIGLGMFVA